MKDGTMQAHDTSRPARRTPQFETSPWMDALRIMWHRPNSVAALGTRHLLLVLLIRIAVSGVALTILTFPFEEGVSAFWLAIALTGGALLGITVARDVGWHIARRKRRGAAVGMDAGWSYALDDLWPFFNIRRRSGLLNTHPDAFCRAIFLYVATLLLLPTFLAAAIELIWIAPLVGDDYDVPLNAASAEIFTIYVLVCLFLRRP